MHLPKVAAAVAIAASVVCVLLTGCTLANTAPTSFDPVPGVAISGIAMGGKQAITNAKVYLLAVSPGGYNSASLSLLTTAGTGNAVDSIGAYTLTANTTGSFGLSGDFDCTKGYALGASTSGTPTMLNGSEQVYLYIVGGNPSAGTNNNIGLMAALGPCNPPYVTQGLNVNEATTIAAAYAFAGFATDATHISSSGTALALTGLSNAGLNTGNLVSLTTGLPVESTTGITRPTLLLYTLANILASCVDGLSGNSNCTKLFQYTESSGATGTAATDTATAAINLAHNPYSTAAGMTALYGLVPAVGAPYTNGLSAQPNDFTVGMNYNNLGISRPNAIAIDASGNAWTAGGESAGLVKLSSTGTLLSSSGGYTGGGLSFADGIAIDTFGNVWVAAEDPAGIAEFSNTGVAITPSGGYTGGGYSSISGRPSIGITGNFWTADSINNRLAEFSSTGTAISPSSGWTGGGLKGPVNTAVDINGNIWTANEFGGSNSLSVFSSTGIASASSPITGGGMNGPLDIAFDSAGYAWVGNIAGSSVSKFSSTGTAVSPVTGYTGGGLNSPWGLAIDGAGNVWASNYNGNSISEFANNGAAITPSSGYRSGAPNEPAGMAIDGSGDVWFASRNSNSLVELIGAGTPVVTPIVSSLLAPYSTAASKP